MDNKDLLPGSAILPDYSAAGHFIEQDQRLLTSLDSIEQLVFINEGGFGEVTKGHDKTFGDVAIKHLSQPPLELTTVELEKLRQEMHPTDFQEFMDTTIRAPHDIEKEGRIALEMNHPNIVRTYYIGANTTDVNNAFVVMEYLDPEKYRSIADILKAGERFSPAQTHNILTQVVEAYRYAQKVGITHEDLSKRNILVDPNGHVKLIDFNLAHITGTFLPSDDIRGTIAYMPPERFQQPKSNGPVEDIINTDRQVVYTLGVLTFEMLAGQPLFPKEQSQEMMMREKIERSYETSARASKICQQIFTRDVSDKLEMIFSESFEPAAYRYDTPEKFLTILQTTFSDEKLTVDPLTPRTRLLELLAAARPQKKE